MTDIVTFTLTLPVCAPLHEYVEFITAARKSHQAAQNLDAAVALAAVETLAKNGLSLINTMAGQPIVQTSHT